jgi:ribonuclease E
VAAVPSAEREPEPEFAPAPVAVQAPAAPMTMQVDSLQEMLAKAGLTLAVTDPLKLRAAQEASAAIAPAPRVPRERKPLPPVSNEPLVQVETRR